ncbi:MULTISPECIES: hypothetical protein [Sphingomonas]|uniref:hypothetical protein n=1 Tax=Sphingomonas TaxID=13687 RepID=UPI000DEF8106|nr:MULTISPECIES: hypothetical protein [Sphingomonas]
MSRAMFVDLSEDQVVAKCQAEKVGISALEKLPGGGVRLVCLSSDGAAVMARKFKSNLKPDTTKREPFRPAYSRA